jgi:hypothetical protein
MGDTIPPLLANEYADASANLTVKSCTFYLNNTYEQYFVHTTFA